MTDRVPASEIEGVVGRHRHPTDHYARAVTAEQRVYILHSRKCLDSTPDLRDCPFSFALDRGITDEVPWSRWQHVPDRPVRVRVLRGWLVPDLLAMRGAS